MSESICAAIKNRVRLRTLASLLGMDLPRDGVKFCSPFRPDRNPSCSVREDEIVDWSMGKGFDVIDVFAEVKRVPRSSAIRDLARLYQVLGDVPTHPRPRNESVASRTNEPENARKRASWPKFEPPSESEIRQIAELRGLGVEGVRIAAERGLLFCTTDRGHRAWVVTDSSRRNARIRRLDGGLWYEKSKTLPPSGGGHDSSWMVGCVEASSYPHVVLVEGEGDLLAGLHLAWCAGVEQRIGVAAMFGAQKRICQESLAALKGKRIRLFPDNDPAGLTAAGAWVEQLREAGATVDYFVFNGLLTDRGLPVKDLTDFVHVCPSQWEEQHGRIESALSFTLDVPRTAKGI